ncbi:MULTISPECIES: RNA polymerase sigma factor [Novosphingobium]|uniref:RNA polymerase sigma factor n=1 Tax=Novosphingobium TaxID=165696 RepID=UPI002D787947|nr:RNA polymerase sigma factor [Novosphingobium sp. RL4]WRT94358.1 RNA polymerase sigma factor [Novosphingobium sp. RL4]
MDRPASPPQDWNAVGAALVRYLRARGTRPDVADDVAQETLARLIALSQTQQIGSLFALGFRIADNLIVDLQRREMRQDYCHGSRQSGEADEEWESDDPSLDRVLDSRRALDVLSLCLRRMPPLRREVLIRRRLNHESCRAIGDDLSISAKAVEKHITRGLLDLRRALERAGVDLAGHG